MMRIIDLKKLSNDQPVYICGIIFVAGNPYSEEHWW